MSMLRCDLCGEIITCPYQHEGKIYGYTCITKVNPGASKNKIKEHWVNADSYTSKLLDNGTTKIIATYKGNHYKVGKFIDFYSKLPNLFKKHIIIQDNEAFINLFAFKNGQLYEKRFF